jgi:exopolysaccharide biosynthesis polyprenyl glycosylphosphotransferase
VVEFLTHHGPSAGSLAEMEAGGAREGWEPALREEAVDETISQVGGHRDRGPAGTVAQSASVPDQTASGGTAPDAAWGLASDISAPDRRGYVLRRLFVLSDLLAVACAGAITAGVALLAGRDIAELDFAISLFFLVLWVPIGIAFGAYHSHAAGRSLATTVGDEVGPVFWVATVWSWLMLLTRAALHTGIVELLPQVALWIVVIPTVLAVRSLTRRLARSRRWYRQRALVVGSPADRARILARFERHPEWGIDVAQTRDLFTEATVASQRFDGYGVPSLGDSRGGESETQAQEATQAQEQSAGGALVDIAQRLHVSRVIFATAPEQLDVRTSLSRRLTAAGIQVDLVPGDSEILSTSAELYDLEGLPILSMPPIHARGSLRALKRCLDLLLGVPALVLVSPVIAFCAMRIKLDSSGPVFFRQVRAGRDGRRFEFLKLRTMDTDAEERLAEVADLNKHGSGLLSGAFKAIDDPRMTRTGVWLRRRSLDELPQLWNVVRGDMSLVGPRPLPLREDAHISGHYEVRREVRPGMTGPWQVLGRSDIPFDDMLKLDYSYVMNWSFIEDLRLLLHTVSAVMRARGAY